MVLGADIARMLWEAILRRFGTADAFDWSLLVEDDLLRTEQIMLAHWSQSTTYKRCTQLQFMLRALAAAPGGGIVRPMDVAFTTPRTDDSERYTLDGQLDRMKRLPSEDAMYAVADIYASAAFGYPDFSVSDTRSCLKAANGAADYSDHCNGNISRIGIPFPEVKFYRFKNTFNLSKQGLLSLCPTSSSQ